MRLAMTNMSEQYYSDFPLSKSDLFEAALRSCIASYYSYRAYCNYKVFRKEIFMRDLNGDYISYLKSFLEDIY